MSNSSRRRYGKAVLGATALALLASTGVASAAPPELYYAYTDPSNPRTGTEVAFSAYGSDPEDKTLQYAWDFAGGTAFGALASTGQAKHTFTTDGIHWVTSRLQDADGEVTDTRMIVATHPDNWNPIGSFDSGSHHDNAVTESEAYASGQYLAVHMYDPDSPESGFGYAWDLDNDGDFNDGAGDGEPLIDSEGAAVPYQRIAHFKTDGTHPIRIKFSDGQGGESVVSGTVRTHTANEAPYIYWGGEARELTLADIAAGVTLQTYWSDDYSYGSSTYTWKIGDTVQEGEVDSTFTLPTNLEAGDYEVKVTATDDGRNPDDTSEPTGPALSRTVTIPVKVVAGYPASVFASGLDHGDDATFRTLENISIYAHPATGQHPTAYAWDLDNDGQFDDATGYSTYFAAANKGTYRVSARMTLSSGDPVVVTKDLVVDKGQDYAPAVNTGTGGGATNTGGSTTTTGGGGTAPPVATPEQVKAAMVTFLSNETAEFLQLVTGQNKKGVDAGKALLVLGTLGPDVLPNGGTGKFDVYDKAPKLARAAAAKKPKLLGTTKVTLAKGQSKKVTVKLNKKGKALLKKKGKVKLTVRATLTDALTGAQVKQVKSYTFKVKKKKKRR